LVEVRKNTHAEKRASYHVVVLRTDQSFSTRERYTPSVPSPYGSNGEAHTQKRRTYFKLMAMARGRRTTSVQKIGDWNGIKNIGRRHMQINAGSRNVSSHLPGCKQLNASFSRKPIKVIDSR
jgi:hypothetical protein